MKKAERKIGQPGSLPARFYFEAFKAHGKCSQENECQETRKKITPACIALNHPDLLFVLFQQPFK